MARITVEDCLEQIPNRFQLVWLPPTAPACSIRVTPQDRKSKNKPGVTALREIAAPAKSGGNAQESSAVNWPPPIRHRMRCFFSTFVRRDSSASSGAYS